MNDGLGKIFIPYSHKIKNWTPKIDSWLKEPKNKIWQISSPRIMKKINDNLLLLTNRK